MISILFTEPREEEKKSGKVSFLFFLLYFSFRKAWEYFVHYLLELLKRNISKCGFQKIRNVPSQLKKNIKQKDETRREKK